MTATRITRQTIAILAAFLADPLVERWGNQIAREADLKSGSLYPALIRLEQFGWLSSRWEEIDPSEEKRPRRRLYRLTGEGEQVARDVVAREGTANRRRVRPSGTLRSLPGGAGA